MTPSSVVAEARGAKEKERRCLAVSVRQFPTLSTTAFLVSDTDSQSHPLDLGRTNFEQGGACPTSILMSPVSCLWGSDYTKHFELLK